MEPLLDYIEQIQQDDPTATSRSILPEFVPRGCGSTSCTTSTPC